MHHLRVLRHVEHHAAARPRQRRPPASRTAAATPSRPRQLTDGGAEDAPERRINRTCSWYDATPAAEAAFQVSTSTRPRASDWPDTEVRRTCLSPDAHRPSTCQREVAVPVVTRTRTSTQLFFGVTADHDATSWVKPYPGEAQGDVQVPTSYRVPR